MASFVCTDVCKASPNASHADPRIPTVRVMAYIVDRERKPKKGEKKPEVSYQVKWRTGGTATGHPESETFHDRTEAEYFKAAVKRAGENWPPNYIPKKGWVDPATYRYWVGDGSAEVEEPAEQVTFADFANEWVDSLSGIEGQSRHRYRRILTLHILPWFGEAPIGDTKLISPQRIGAWVNQLLDGAPAPNSDESREPLRPKSIRNVHGVLYAVLQMAADSEPPLRATNPARKTRLPKVDDGEGDDEMVFLTPEEFDVVAALMKPDAADLARFLVGTGLRYSEATALQVRDLDLMSQRPRLSVRRAWKKQEDGTWKLGPPKTPTSKRNVSLTPAQVSMLLGMIVGKRPGDLVFVSPSGGRWIHQTFYTQRWRPAVYLAVRCEVHRAADRAAGIGLRGFRELKSEHIAPCGCLGTLEKVPRIHDLRHTQVAWQIRLNQPMKAIQRRLGHESIQTTMDRYGHLLPDIDDDMVLALDALMARGRETVPIS